MAAADWMRDLSTEIRHSRPICQLVIPGSHDSLTYHLDKTLPVGPDTNKGARRLGNLFPCVKSIIYKWSKCQSIDVEEQLIKGVRYIDIRIGILPRKNINSPTEGDKEDLSKFRVIHALYGEQISTPLDAIARFLEIHKSEVVILDFQHTYSFSGTDHNLLVKEIQRNFGKKLCPKNEIIANLTLDRMKERGYQVIAIYPKMATPTNLFMWPRCLCPNPWANTTKIEILSDFLKEGLEKRDDQNAFFVSQAILTPTLGTIRSHLTSSLEKTLAKICDAFVIKWLSENPSNLNIVIVDFIGKDDIIEILIQSNR